METFELVSGGTERSLVVVREACGEWVDYGTQRLPVAKDRKRFDCWIADVFGAVAER
jgi:hypothetical protein